jgi:hypothetical protein
MTQYETAVEMDIGSLQRRVAALERQMTQKRNPWAAVDEIKRQFPQEEVPSH